MSEDSLAKDEIAKDEPRGAMDLKEPQPWTAVQVALGSVGEQHSVLRLAEVDSTMAVARLLERTCEFPNGFTIVATKQAAGRGRGAKTFASPPGGFYGTTVLPLQAPASAAGLPIMVGVVVADAVTALSGGMVKLKWPNDLLTGSGAKVGGILVESFTGRFAECISIGVGVNVVSPPGGLDVPAASLNDLNEGKFEIADFAETYLRQLLVEFPRFRRDGVASFVPRWMDYAWGVGQVASLENGSYALVATGEMCSLGSDQALRGLLLGLDASGYLLLDTEQGVARAITGNLKVACS